MKVNCDSLPVFVIGKHNWDEYESEKFRFRNMSMALSHDILNVDQVDVQDAKRLSKLPSYY